MNTSVQHNSMIQTLNFGLNQIPKDLEQSQHSVANQPVPSRPGYLLQPRGLFPDCELGFFLMGCYLAQQAYKKVLLILLSAKCLKMY